MAGRGKRGPGRLIAAGSIAAVALAVVFILINYVFVIQSVEVNGSGDIPAEDVIRLSGVRFGARMKSIDEAYLRDNVESDGRLALESIEWVYPNRLILNVRQRTPDAMAIQSRKVLLMDSDGYVISISDQLPDVSVPYVTGMQITSYSLGRQIQTDEECLAAMKAVVEAVKAQNAGQYVSEVSVQDPKDIRIITRTGMYVLLGDGQNMDNKIIWMVSAVQDLESRGEISGTLDVSSGTKADYSAS